MSKRKLEVLPGPQVERYAPYADGILTLAAIATGKPQENWDTYYRNNTTASYKDRHYLGREFPEILETLSTQPTSCSSGVTIVELGCGVGNALIPLLREFAGLRGVGVDISPIAVQLFREKLVSRDKDVADRATVAVHNLVDGPLPQPILATPAPLATLIFVLCSVPIDQHARVAEHVCASLAPGGFLLFRDYCKGDLAEERFDAKRRLDSATCVRSNGTLSHFFTEEEVIALFCTTANQMRVVESKVVEREVENRSELLKMQRRWVQVRFQKLSSAAT
jgi:SAM-dependent methyltransferase